MLRLNMANHEDQLIYAISLKRKKDTISKALKNSLLMCALRLVTSTMKTMILDFQGKKKKTIH